MPKAITDSVSSQLQLLKILIRKSSCQWAKSESIHEGSTLQSDISSINEAACAFTGGRTDDNPFSET
jgi:hypothetical protein